MAVEISALALEDETAGADAFADVVVILGSKVFFGCSAEAGGVEFEALAVATAGSSSGAVDGGMGAGEAADAAWEDEAVEELGRELLSLEDDVFGDSEREGGVFMLNSVFMLEAAFALDNASVLEDVV